MRKSTMQSIVNFLSNVTDPEMVSAREELVAELNRNAAKAQANRELYDTAREAVIAVFTETPNVELTVKELVEAANLPEGFSASKVQYGLLHYWDDVVEKHDNGREPNTYSLRG